MVEVRTIADGFLNYTKATAISLNGIRLLCYLGILCQVALTDHSTRKIPGRYHIYISVSYTHLTLPTILRV